MKKDYNKVMKYSPFILLFVFSFLSLAQKPSRGTIRRKKVHYDRKYTDFYQIQKQKQIKKVAELYLYEKEIREIDCRFDVIAIILEDEKNPQITHYVNAFM